MKFFRKGVRLPDFKERTLCSAQIDLPESPPFVRIACSQYSHVPAKPCVRVGDQVFVGTKIADGLTWKSVPVFSSVSGKVSEITTEFIQIDSDGADKMDASVSPREAVPTQAERLIEMIREAGIIDLGGGGFPIHTRLADARKADVETVVLNGCESEPFLTTDHLLMMNFGAEILKGSELLRIAAGAKRAVIVIQSDKREALEILNSKNYALKLKTVEIALVPIRYPQGSERVLVETVTGRELPWGQTPVSRGVLVENVATAFAVYEAAYLRKPLYERVVTASGPCLAEPKNLWARTGTRVIDVLSACRGLLRDPERIVLGGPMTGKTIQDLNHPMVLELQGVLTLPHELAHAGGEEPCIRCGWCVDACPESLIPETLVRAVRGDDRRLARAYSIDACTECGACDYVCPSKIPITSILHDGKEAPDARPSTPKHVPDAIPTGYARPVQVKD